MPAQRVDLPRLNRIMEKVIRGLFFAEYHRRLSQDHRVLTLFVNPIRQRAPRDDFEVWRYRAREMLAGGGHREVGRRVLVYYYNRDPECPFSTVWGLTFYGRLHFFAFTGSKASFREPGVQLH